jgi:ribosomal protein S18 acetylase RimI-like enzyme
MFEILPLSDVDYDAAAKLMDESLGRGSFSSAKVRALATEANGRLLCARDEHGELLGIAHARVLPPRRIGFYRAFGAATQRLQDKHVGSLYVSVVLSAARGRGVGMALARARLAWLSEQRCDYAIGISWQSGLPNTSRSIFERLGFQVLSTSKDFFADAEKQGESGDCSVCGTSCHCLALLFGREL